MTQARRILIALTAVIIIVAVVLGIDAIRRARSTTPAGEGQVTLEPGNIPIYVDGRLEGAFSPDGLDQLEQVSFVDAEEGKTQDGWLLRDVLLRNLEADVLQPETRIKVSSASRGKAAELTWAEVDESTNMVMFDLAQRGTLKLVSRLEKLDTRDEWVQDVDKIEIEMGQ
jgi:hypothetical protein